MPDPKRVETILKPRAGSLSARAADRLQSGPLDAVTLMCDVCQIDRLSEDAAQRMAMALLGTRDEFVRLPAGLWALRSLRQSPMPSSSAQLQASVAGAGAEHYAHNANVGESSFDQISFAVVDVETTGAIASRGDRITEIAIACVERGKITSVYEQLVNPERVIPPFIASLTGITQDMVRDMPLFGDIAIDVADKLAGKVFTAHNVKFDWRFVSSEIERASGNVLSGPRLCTVKLARVLLPDLPRRSLDHVTRYFGVSIGSRHRAGGDALATAEVLLRLLRVAEDQGIYSWEALGGVINPTSAKGLRKKKKRSLPPLPISLFEDSHL